jgi:hypothetical protein
MQMQRFRQNRRSTLLLMALGTLFGLACVVGIGLVMASVLLAVVEAASLALGFGIGYFGYQRLGVGPSSQMPSSVMMLFGFALFVLSGGWMFVIGLSVFLLGVILCGIGLATTICYARPGSNRREAHQG